MTALDMFERAALKFCNKVETGKARSAVTYAELTAALNQLEIERNHAKLHASLPLLELETKT